jgi:hypothetical protein
MMGDIPVGRVLGGWVHMEKKNYSIFLEIAAI